MKTALSLPDDLFARADREAARRGLSRSALYAEALRQFLKPSDEPDPITTRLDEMYGDQGPASGELGRQAALSWIDDGSWTW